MEKTNRRLIEAGEGSSSEAGVACPKLVIFAYQKKVKLPNLVAVTLVTRFERVADFI